MISGNSPALFIGSSKEALDVAYALQEGLDYDTEPTVWTQGVFEPTKSSLAALLSSLHRFDLSAFIFTPDDIAVMRGAAHRIARDNVLFEFGLFVGRLGADRCFYLLPRAATDFHLPTDLLGTTALTYRADRKDSNLVAALGPACNQIRRSIRRLAQRKVIEKPGPTAERTLSRSFQKSLDEWGSPKLERARKVLRRGVSADPRELSVKERLALQRTFSFLEALADHILSGEVAEDKARAAYSEAVLSFWPVAMTALAPPDHADEWWDPPPKLAQLYSRWHAGDEYGAKSAKRAPRK